ncbi:hypothetical protein FHR87_003412 [Azomonas macrocytogenes]|uniref:Uncharacterized protein n=1 Tax=Azomonas macrocytogenes TaxID=69962 RepID=A0A839TBM0_AZOMA|nr:hypothetical protein [Azomonas macrocytogenes]
MHYKALEKMVNYSEVQTYLTIRAR